MADSLEEGLQIAVEALFAKQQGEHHRRQGSNRSGQLIEGEFDPLQGQPGTGTDKECEKNQKWQQGPGTGLDLDHVFL